MLQWRWRLRILVPGSQPPFSIIPDLDQNKEDTSFISVVAYGVYIPLARPTRFCLLTNQDFEKNAKILQILRTLDPVSECFFADFHGFHGWGSNHFIRETPAT